MSFAKASKKKEDVKQGGSNHITGSGVFPVTILAPVVGVSKNGSTTVDLYLDHQGQKQIIYGSLRVTNNDGTPNKIGAKVFNQLMIIAGLDEVADPVEVELPIGKNSAMKTVTALEDLAETEVLMRIQMEYSIYNGAMQEKKVIKAFFRTSDKATAEEIVNDKDFGDGYERELKYVNNVTYKNDVTPEQVTAWIASGRKETGSSSSSSSTTKAPAFGKKRFGADKEEATSED